jgi:tetratricopeptide (TPR) repeat protein
MMRPNLNFARLAALLVVTLLTAACASPGKQPEQATTPSGQPLPSDPNALVLGAEVALQRGQYREAAMAYVRAATSSSDEQLCEQAARVAFEHQQWTLVLEAANHWLQLNQTSEEAHRFAAFSALHLYEIDVAAEHLNMLLQTAFINPQAGFLQLLPQISDEAPAAGATAVLQKLVEKYPDLTEAHYALAQAAVQSDNFALALQHAQKARELGQFWSPSGLLLARVQMLMGDHDAALETARTVVEQDRQDSYRLEYALMLMQAGKEAEGRKELEALSTTESGPVAERALADIDFQLGNRDAAAQRFTSLMQNGRFVYESLFYLGAIAESREAWDDALQYYGRVTGGEFAMGAQTRAARIKAKQQGLDVGLKHLEEFAATRSQYRIDSIIARANLLATSDDASGALALLDSALKEYPDSAELRFARVFQLETANKVSESIAELRKLVADRPGDPAATNALGYILVDRTPRQSREGMKLIEEALAQTPDSGAVLDSMGWALHRVGRNDDALKYLEHAKRRISDPEVDLHLGEVLQALNRKDEAREVLSKASERYPDNDDLKQSLQKLK